MSNYLSISLTTLYTFSMITITCGLLVVTSIRFGFNAMIVLHAHLSKFTFEFSSALFVKVNKSRFQVKSWMDVVELFVDLTISNNHVLITKSILVSTSRVVFWMVLLLLMDPPDPEIQCQNLLFWLGAGHIYCVYAPSFSFDILDKWNINNDCLTPCVILDHVMLFLILFSVLVCPG
jgi:hypothetical protein